MRMDKFSLRTVVIYQINYDFRLIFSRADIFWIVIVIFKFSFGEIGKKAKSNGVLPCRKITLEKFFVSFFLY